MRSNSELTQEKLLSRKDKAHAGVLLCTSAVGGLIMSQATTGEVPNFVAIEGVLVSASGVAIGILNRINHIINSIQTGQDLDNRGEV